MKLSDLDFSALLPRFMRAQTDDVAMGDALSWMLKARQAGVESLNVLEWLRTTTNVEQMDDLAQAFGLVWWKPDWNLETKREMLLKSELIRQNPGTKWALEFLLQKWFGDPELVVEEWFSYGGLPYTFRVLTASPDVQRKLQFSRIMETLKRTSQSMDGIFLGFSMRGAVRLGAKGSESRTTRGEAMRWPYIPKGTRYTHPDALEELLWESGQTGTDAARAAVSAATGTGGVLTKDFPLIFAGDDTSTALPIRSSTRAAYQQAMASQWQAVGAEIAEPSMSWVWPRETPPASLLDGVLSCWEFSSGSNYLSSVPGDDRKLNQVVGSAIATDDGLIGGGIDIQNDNSKRQALNQTTNKAQFFGLGLPVSGAIWIKPSETQTQTKFRVLATFQKCGGSGYLCKLAMSYGGMTPMFRINYGSNTIYGLQSTKGAVEAGVWHLIAFTFDHDSHTLRLYVDGELAAEDTEAQLLATTFTSEDVSYGLCHVYSTEGSGGGCIGVYDQMSVWQRCLSEADIRALYNGGNGLAFEDWT